LHLTRLAFNVVKVILRWVRFNLVALSHFVEAVLLWLYSLDTCRAFQMEKRGHRLTHATIDKVSSNDKTLHFDSARRGTRW